MLQVCSQVPSLPAQFLPNLRVTHLFFKLKHSLITVANKIIGSIRHRVFLIKKLCDVETADVHIKMNIASVKIWRTSFPRLRVRVHTL